ncbi:MAG: pilus assembly protein TadG-related protein [Tabrizicola sp.]|nr:pilus assembly protein TadG-related protein [Paracoccaceae bacterium]MDZ4068790.1 pilus assembly protein TadG-related protein [Tabrizicola sp.]
MTREPATTLAHDERGTILVLWGILLGVVLGFVALSFDLGRASITRSELQSFADSVALAAAGELDGNPDSITRATNVAALILDQQSFGNTDRSLQGAVDYTLTYFRSLPTPAANQTVPNDLSPMTDVTTDPARAAYVRVAVTPTVVESTFGAAFAALTGQQNRDYTLGAEAVAGLSILACDITPMFFCLPQGTPFRADDNIGTMIQMRRGGPQAGWQPGNFGFLDPRGGLEVDPTGPCRNESGANLLQCLLGAVDNITQCFDQRGVLTDPGQSNGLMNTVFNIRFDIYTGNMRNARSDPNYAPAPNVIKGRAAASGGNGNGGGGNSNACNPPTVTTSAALPRDTVLINDPTRRFGDGVWSRTNYVNLNYGGTDPHPGATTRYRYYLDELARAGTGRILAAPRLETGRPSCSTVPPAGPDRRIITVAGIDCSANGFNGRATVPVREFFKIFLTEPITEDDAIYGEIIGSASEAGTGAVGTGGIVRDVVQLYR